MSGRSRRWLIVVGIPALTAGVVLAVVRPFAVRPIPPEGEGIPAEWLAPLASVPPPAEAAGEETGPAAASPPVDGAVPRSPPDPLPVGYVQRGKLAYDLDGRRVAEETYRLERSGDDEVRLTSSGSFFFRVLFVSVRVAFDQEIELDAELRPRAYTLETRGPLGLGDRRIAVCVEGEVATAVVGEEKRELAVPEGDALFAGTLAAYVILPALFAARAANGVLEVAAVGAGAGPPRRTGSGSAGDGGGELRRQGTVEVHAGGSAVVLERYRVQAGGFAGTLLARGIEFVAFLGEGERALTAYREDLFPRGLPREAGRGGL